MPVSISRSANEDMFQGKINQELNAIIFYTHSTRKKFKRQTISNTE